MREIGEEIDPQITQIFTDWGRRRMMGSPKEESQASGGMGGGVAQTSLWMSGLQSNKRLDGQRGDSENLPHEQAPPSR